jgi:CheY-like chemotaxis protein
VANPRVLIVEDNVLSATVAKEMLSELGYTVAGTAASVDNALAAILGDRDFDCVMLDVRLGQELSNGVAALLLKENLPFIICSGYGIKLPGMNIPVVDKPYTLETLGEALSNAIGNAGGARPELRP